MTNVRWQDGLCLLAGVWLATSPWLLGFSEDLQMATWSALISGGIVVMLAAIDIDEPSRPKEWAIAAVGFWTIGSPFVLAFAGERMVAANAVLAGVAVAALAGWALLSTSRAGAHEGHAHGH